ncbi:MAG TPA: TolC family protein [Xanthobacteraceae bacterium]
MDFFRRELAQQTTECSVMRQVGGRTGIMACALAVPLAACAVYAPEPLADRPDLRQSVAQLAVAADRLPLREVGSHRFDLRRPLDIDDVAMIAIAHNPDLKAARRRIGVAEAQVFAAGILPNPQLSLDYAFLTGGPGTTDAVMAGLAQDVVPLLTLSSRREAARASAASVELTVAWLEWQTVSRARTLFVDAVSLARQRRLVDETYRLLDARYERAAAAMRRGDQTLPTVTSDLVAMNAAETQLNEIDQLILKNRHDLNALLGLVPDAPLRLDENIALPAIDLTRLAPALMDLASRRPDLLALRIGYEAQEQQVRQAIIEQFPKLSIGSNFARDTTDVRSQSIALTVSIPVFDRNQGNIAIQDASREQLHEEYQARLDAAFGEAKRLVTELRLLESQYGASIASVQRLREAVGEAEPAFRAGNLDERSFVDLQTSLLAKELATAKLEQGILQQRILLQTLVGSRLPDRHHNLPRMP